MSAETYPKFEFYEYNMRRQMRGAEAVRIKVWYGPHDELGDLLWMSRLDISKNIKEYGMTEAFKKGLKCYQEWSA